MGKKEKIYEAVIHAQSDSNIAFTDLISLLTTLGFQERIKGSHHILTREGINERITLQSDGKHAKAYQVRQIRQILNKYQELSP